MTYINHVSIPENYTLSLTPHIPLNSYPLKHLHPHRGRLRFAPIPLNLPHNPLHPPQNLETPTATFTDTIQLTQSGTTHETWKSMSNMRNWLDGGYAGDGEGKEVMVHGWAGGGGAGLGREGAG